MLITPGIGDSGRSATRHGQLSDRTADTATQGILFGPVIVPAESGARRQGLLLRGRERVAAAARVCAAGIRPFSAVWWSLLSVLCAILLWRVALPGVEIDRMNDLGLVSVLPPAFFACLLLLTISFCLVVHREQAPEILPFLHVVVLILVIHGTPAILYGTLRYSWAWKHVGIVDYIQRHGSVNPNIDFLNVYHNWPGFFAMSALVTEVAGFASPLSFAAWAPVFFNLLDLGALLLILRTCTTDRRLLWLGIWFFYLANWVGQDYFSPQALNFFLHLVILGICLRWFGAMPSRGWSMIARWSRGDRVVACLRRLRGRRAHAVGSLLFRGGFHHAGSWETDHAAGGRSWRSWLRGEFRRLGSRPAPCDTLAVPLAPFQHAGLMAMIILLAVTIITSHQLTPVMMILAVSALVAFRRCNTGHLPLLLVVLMATWVIYSASAYLDGQIQSIVRSIGRLEENLDRNLIDVAQASPGQRLIAFVGRGLTGIVGVLAFLGGVRRLRRGYWDLPCVLLTLTPILMLAGNSYGGEILFRVYFFALPFLAFFAAALLYPSPEAGTSWATAAAAVVLSGILLGGFCIAYYGKEQANRFTTYEVEAAEYLYSVAPPGTRIIEGASNYPSRFRNYEWYTHLPLGRQRQDDRLDVVNDPVGVLSRWMGDERYPAAYLIITRSHKAQVDMTGVMPAGSLDRIEQTLWASELFTVVFANRDATIFVLRDPAAGSGQPAAGASFPSPGTGGGSTGVASLPRGMIASHPTREARHSGQAATDSRSGSWWPGGERLASEKARRHYSSEDRGSASL